MRFALLQARLPEDLVREEERAAFASRLGVPVADVHPFDLLLGVEPQRLMEFDAVLVGGSGAFGVGDDVGWMRPFIDTMGALADAGFPTFASCFGFQALVVALGGEVIHDEERAEVGSFDLEPTPHASDDPVFGHLPDTFVAQLGHKDSATRLPSGVVYLAMSQRCHYQALRVGDAPVYATQFHPELTGSDNRLRFSRYLDMYAKYFGETEAERMLEAFREGPESNALLRRFRESIEL